MRGNGVLVSVPSQRAVQEPLTGSHSQRSSRLPPVEMSQPPKTMAFLMAPAKAIEWA